MKLLILYGLLVCQSITTIEEYNKIKALLNDPLQLLTYLESKDQHSNTPLMRLFDRASDDQIGELIPKLKGQSFNLELQGLQKKQFFLMPVIDKVH